MCCRGKLRTCIRSIINIMSHDFDRQNVLFARNWSSELGNVILVLSKTDIKRNVLTSVHMYLYGLKEQHLISVHELDVIVCLFDDR